MMNSRINDLRERMQRSAPPALTRDRLTRVRQKARVGAPQPKPPDTITTPGHQQRDRALKKAQARRELERAVRDSLGGASPTTMAPGNLAELVHGVAEQLRPQFEGQVSPAEWEDVVGKMTRGLGDAGFLGPLLEDDSVVEIMINGPERIFVERVNGRTEPWAEVFCDEEELILTINTMLAQTGRRLSPATPLVDGRLRDGSRLHAVHDVLSTQGTCVTIRKFRRMLNLDSLLRNGTVDARIARFLKACVLAERSLLVTGGTGTGKTTLLNVLLELAPRHERLIAIEAVSEIRFHQPNAINMETRLPSVDGKGAVDQRELVQNALRMRPDRIIVGEVRGGEAMELLQAMNTGHPGSMGTLHANSPRDALRRMQTLALMSGVDLPLPFVARLVCEALDFVIHLDRDTHGNRRVVTVEEVLGLEGDTIVSNPIFLWEPDANSPQGGRHVATGIPPSCLAELNKVDDLPDDFFNQDT